MTEPAPPAPQPAPVPLAPPQKTSALAIVALVLACLFFVPLVPFLGAILGIVALVRRRPGYGNGVAIAAIAVGFAVGFVFTGIIAAISIPAFIQYTRRAREAEAKEMVHRIARSLQDYHESEHVAADGSVTVGRFPVVDGRCDQRGYPGAPQRMGKSYVPAADAWDAPCWKQIQFEVREPLYYDYHYRIDGSGDPGSAVLVWAEADLDTDGQIAIWYLEGVIGPQGEFLRPAGMIKSDTLGGQRMDWAY